MSIFGKMKGFSDHAETLGGVRVSWSMGGSGAPLVLLHGFPQTRAMWAGIASGLGRSHRVICPDLRGYGDSGKPEGLACMSFREMGRDLLALMDHLGFERFAVAGHDRGARVAHRLALDVPQRISRLCLMDIVPTHTLLSELRPDVAAAYYHWFFLAQPAPLPERLIAGDPDFYFQSCLLGWGDGGLSGFGAAELDAYRAAWRQPETIRAMCDDYRAALIHDMEDDRADLADRIACPVLVLYGADGIMARAYDMKATWVAKCRTMRAEAIPGGHFFPDTHPDATASALHAYFSGHDIH